MSVFIILYPDICQKSALNAIGLCVNTVIPYLFPFIFCGNIFIALGAAGILRKYVSKIMIPLFGINGSGALAFILGIVSGYPVGAICAASLYESGECSKDEAENLSAFCNNSGPMFVIGVLGVSMLSSKMLGIFLYVIHIISSVLVGIILKFLYSKKPKNQKCLYPSTVNNNIKSAAPDIGAAMEKSILTILKICGFVIFFAVFTSTIQIFSGKKYIYPLIEITGGIKELIASSNSSLLLPLVSAYIAFSGFSVMAQVASVLNPSKLSIKKYVFGKVIHAIIAFILTYAGTTLLPIKEPVFLKFNDITPLSAKEYLIFSLAVTIFTFISTSILIVAIKFFEKKAGD